jgi:tRNA-dihydrouridine synthase A
MHKASIAPMMQYTDMHDRYLLRLISKKVFLYTEMVTTGAILYGKCFHQLEFNKEEHPVAIQLGGSDIDDLVESSKIAEDYGYDEINLNVGCPSDRVQKGRFGACLMLEPDHVAECLNAMQTNVKVHARNGILKGLSPRQNRHIPPLKYDYVYQLKKDFPNLNITINGGIKTIDECKDHLKYVDGVMIGRAAYENPFLIKDIDTELYGVESNVNSKKSILNEYLDYVEERLQEGHDLSRMMKHLFGLSRGDKFAKTFRIKILEVIKKESLNKHRKELEDLLIY